MAGHNGLGPRAAVVAEGVGVEDLATGFPERTARLGLDGPETKAVRNAVKEERPAAGDGRSAIPFPDRRLPHHPRAIGLPGGRDPGQAARTGAGGAEERAPILPLAGRKIGRRGRFGRRQWR